MQFPVLMFVRYIHRMYTLKVQELHSLVSHMQTAGHKEFGATHVSCPDIGKKSVAVFTVLTNIHKYKNISYSKIPTASEAKSDSGAGRPPALRRQESAAQGASWSRGVRKASRQVRAEPYTQRRKVHSSLCLPGGKPAGTLRVTLHCRPKSHRVTTLTRDSHVVARVFS